MNIMENEKSSNTSKDGFPLKSGRWIAEMREIASTYVSQSLNSGSLDNSAYIYSLVSLIENKEIKDLSNLMNELNINSK